MILCFNIYYLQTLHQHLLFISINPRRWVLAYLLTLFISDKMYIPFEYSRIIFQTLTQICHVHENIYSYPSMEIRYKQPPNDVN